MLQSDTLWFTKSIVDMLAKLNAHENRIASSVLNVTRFQLNRSPIRRHFFGRTDSRQVGAKRRQVHRLPTHNNYNKYYYNDYYNYYYYSYYYSWDITCVGELTQDKLELNRTISTTNTSSFIILISHSAPSSPLSLDVILSTTLKNYCSEHVHKNLKKNNCWLFWAHSLLSKPTVQSASTTLKTNWKKLNQLPVSDKLSEQCPRWCTLNIT